MDTIEAAKKPKKEKTIRSETTRVFLVIFAILVIVGAFNIVSNLRGMKTFDTVQQVYLKQYDAAENMGKKAADIIALAYLLAGDHDMNLLMTEMMKYPKMIETFQKSSDDFLQIVSAQDSKESQEILAVLEDVNKVFKSLNTNASNMTIAIMEGNSDKSKKVFVNLNKDIVDFRAKIKFLIESVAKNLEKATSEARAGLLYTSILGAGVIFLSIFITIGLIYYLMSFLSISLLPISNLMHNLRQAVFTIDKDQNVVAPVSAYSSNVFGKDIVGNSVFDTLYKDIPEKSQVMTGITSAFSIVFGEDDIQWMSMEDCLPLMIDYKLGDEDNILKLTYTPLMDKSDCVQSVMIVAEDVTEIEKLRSEAKKKEGEVAVIQALVGVDSLELENFLQASKNLTEESFQFFEGILSDTDLRGVLFRNLHTIKGNSRMHGFNILSEVVHEAESVLAAINTKISEKEGITDHDIEALKNKILIVESTIANHYQLAEKFVSTKNIMKPTMFSRLSYNMSFLEYYFTEEDWQEIAATDQDGQDTNMLWRGFAGGGESILQQTKDIAEILNFEHLSENIAKVRWNDGSTKEIMLEACKQFSADYLADNQNSLFSVDKAKWSTLFQNLLELVLISNDLEKKRQILVSALRNSRELHISYLQSQLCYALTCAESDDSRSLPEAIKNIWSYLYLVVHSDSTHYLSESESRFLLDLLNQEPVSLEDLDKNLEKIGAPDCLLITLMREHAKIGGTDTKLVDSCEKVLALREVDISKYSSFLVGAGSINDLQERLQNIHQNLNSDVGNDVFMQIIERLPYKFSLLISMKEQLCQSNEAQEGSYQSETQPKVEVTLENARNIKSIMRKIIGQKSTASDFDELSELISSTFDYPLKSLFSSVKPIVIDMAENLEKKVELRITGDNILIDQEVALNLKDALVHIVRNTMDHGIEQPEVRIEQGKDEKGMLHLECSHLENGMYQIRVSDDGSGVDREKLVSKAIQKGIIHAEKANQMDQNEKLNLLFISGLSSKDEVSSFSGRGVGMDAVKSMIESLGGELTLTSTAGKGTVLEINLPLQFESQETRKIA